MLARSGGLARRGWLAQRSLLRATAASQRRESLLYLVIALLAAGILSASALAWTASSDSYQAELNAVNAPTLLFTVPAADGAAFAASLRGHAVLARVGDPAIRSQWSAAAGGPSVTADLTVDASPDVPSWLHVRQGPARDTAAVAWVEQGAAAALHVRPGSPLRVSGPAGPRTVTVAGVVGDLSQDAYPLTTPAAVYLSPAAGTELGLSASVNGAQALIPAWETPSGTDAQVAQAAAAAVTSAKAGTYSYSSLGGLPSSVSPLTSFTIGGAAAFGLVALICLLVALASSVALEIRRRERWIGQLRGVGWSVRQLRVLLLWQRLPALVAGAVAGSVLGGAGGPVLAGRVTELYGSDPRTASPWLVGAAISAIVALAGVAAVYRAGRKLQRGTLSGQLRGSDLDRSASVGLGRWWGRTAPRQLAAAAVAGRKLRTASFAGLIGLSVAAVVFGVALAATLIHATQDPAAWGINYTWSVDLPSGAQAASAAAQLGSAPGVTSADALYEGSTQLGRGGPSVAFDLLPAGQSADTPPVVAGRLPRTAGEVSVSSGLAGSDGLAVGDKVALVGAHDRLVTVTVTGITHELDDGGDLILGTTGLTSALQSVTGQEAVLVTCRSSAACAGLPAARAHPGWQYNSAESQIALPFGTTISVVLVILVGALVLLAGTVSGYSGLAVAQQLLPGYALVRACGAQRSQLARATGIYCLLVAVPALAGGVVVGLAAATGGVSAVASSVGGLSVSAPPALICAAALGACALACLSVAGPLLRSASRVPVKALGG